jgi:hypothetical protein
MCRRVTCAVLATSGAVSARKPAKQRSARSAPPTLPGRSTQPIWVRYRRIVAVICGTAVSRSAQPGSAPIPLLPRSGGLLTAGSR